MRTSNRLHTRFGKSEVLHLTFLDQLLHRSRRIFDRHFSINTMLIQQIDSFDLQSLQRSINNISNMRRLAIDTNLLTLWTNLESKFCRDHNLITHRRKRFADEFFVLEWPINFSRVKERHTTLDCLSQQRDHLLFVSRRTVAVAHPHAPKPER